MLYTIFLYHSESGLLLFDKNFHDVSSGKMELFSSFFSALKSFISEMVLTGSKDLKNIELGDYTVLITNISSIKADLVIIGDKDDFKMINKIIPKMIKILMKNQKTFLEGAGRDDFDVLDKPISEFIFTQRKLVGEKSLIEKPEKILKSIWAHKKDLSSQEIENFSKKKLTLTNKLENSINIKEKLAISEQLIEITEKLKDDMSFIKCQERIKFYNDELKDIKLKLKYYLERIKTNLSVAINALSNKPLKEGDFKQVYLNLYSFSNKLKNVSENWEIYKVMANRMINKDEVTIDELSEAISFTLKMKDNVEDYFD